MWRLNARLVTFLFIEWTRIENDILQFFKKILSIKLVISINKIMLCY